MKPMVNEWGPAILVCLTIVAGMIYGNSRLNDLRSSLEGRFNSMDKRFDDLKDWIRSEVKRLEERSSPILRG